MSHSVSKSEAQRTVTEYKASTDLVREEIVSDLNDDAQDFVKSKHAPKLNWPISQTQEYLQSGATYKIHQ